jgi:hypothetical protein
MSAPRAFVAAPTAPLVSTRRRQRGLRFVLSTRAGRRIATAGGVVAGMRAVYYGMPSLAPATPRGPLPLVADVLHLVWHTAPVPGESTTHASAGTERASTWRGWRPRMVDDRFPTGSHPLGYTPGIYRDWFEEPRRNDARTRVVCANSRPGATS